MNANSDYNLDFQLLISLEFAFKTLSYFCVLSSVSRKELNTSTAAGLDVCRKKGNRTDAGLLRKFRNNVGKL